MSFEIHIHSKDSRKHKDDVDFALREMKKALKKSGLMQELRRREHYVAPSKARRIKQNESLKQRKRDANKSQWNKSKNEF